MLWVLLEKLSHWLPHVNSAILLGRRAQVLVAEDRALVEEALPTPGHPNPNPNPELFDSVTESSCSKVELHMARS